jgi:ribosomal protein S8
LKKRLVGMKKIKIKNLQETNKMQMLARKREGTCIAIVKTKLGLWL